MKKLVALEPRIAGFKDYEDREIEKNEVRIRVIFATPKPGTEIVDFRGLSPFIDEEFSEEWRLFLPREEGSQRGVVFWRISIRKYDCRYDRRNGQFGDRVSKRRVSLHLWTHS